MLDRFLDWVLHLPPGPTYAVLAALSALENVFPPVPADVAVALGAFLAAHGEVKAWPLGLVCWAANQASAVGVYLLARAKGPAFFSHGLGRRLVPPEAQAALRQASDRYGVLAVFVSRFLPGLRAGVLPFAGAMGLSPPRALLPAAAASGLWYVFLIEAGVAFGKSLPAVRRLVDDANRVLGLIALAATAALAVWLWRRVRRPAAVLVLALGASARLAGDDRPGGIQLEDRQPSSGIDFVLDNGTVPDKPIIDAVLGGVALLDFDNDGRLDVFFTSGARIPGLVKDDPRFWNRLYRNQGDGTFRDVTERAGVRGEGYSMGAAAADFDNDGWTDLYVTGVNRNLLYRNQGGGSFADVTERAGVAGTSPEGKKLWSVGAAWLDYDNDGDLDLFVANYLDWSPENNRVCGLEGKRLGCSPTDYEGLHNLLYHNEGAGRFRNVSDSTGIGAHVGKGMSVAVADADGDGRVDIFVANDQFRNFLFKNVGGRAFVETGVEAGVAYTEDGVPVSGMGADFRDLDQDGRPDLFVTALSGDRFPLYLNTAEGFFVPATHRSGLGFATIMMSGWGTGAFDLDNDGNPDLFSANSHVSENVDAYGHHRYRQPNALFRGAGDGRFRDVSAQAGAALQHARAHRGCAFGDLDNDGRVDVVVSVIGEPPEVLYNVTTGSGAWLHLQLEGTRSNRDGIGATLKLTGESGRVQYNHVTTAVGYASASDKRVHFGLGADRTVREIEIRWPSGIRQLLRDVSAGQILRVKEP